MYSRPVHTPMGKLTRAEGPAAETKAGRVHVVGRLPELELELCTFDGTGPSPNRYDAAVYGVIETARLEVKEAPADGAREIAIAAAGHQVIRAELSRLGRGRRVGL